MTTEGTTPILPEDDFRSRRHYLPDEAFALPGEYEPPSDPLPEDQWHGLMDFPTDVLLRTTDHHGGQTAQLHLLWSGWIQTLPLEPERAPFMFNAAWDAADDFNASTFCAVHGYYRQGVANLRSVLENLTTVASFAKRQNATGLQAWLSGTKEPPKFGNARDVLTPSLGADVTDVLKQLYKDLSGYIHTDLSGYIHTGPGGTNVALWGGSNGPIWEPDSFTRVYRYYRDVMAMALILLALGWPEFRVPTNRWPLFESPGGAWAGVSITGLQQRFGAK